MGAREVLAEFSRRVGVGIDNAYALAVCLRELSLPKRYREELGFASFEALLASQPFLPSRMTAHKWFTVIGTFSLEEVRQLGGFEKSYLLVRVSRRSDPTADPRGFLGRGKVGGVKVGAGSTRDIVAMMRRLSARPRRPDTGAARRAARQMRTRFRRIAVEAAVRVHVHGGGACVAAHFAEPSASVLVGYLAAALRARVEVT
jgi:hypothetical protein